MKTFAHESCRAEIRRRLRTVHPQSTRHWGRMSAHQMICHLSDACRMALGEKHVSAASGPLQRTFWKWFALYLPLRWPPGILTRPELDPFATGTAPGTFADDVEQLQALFDRMAARDRRTPWPAHPLFGRMSAAAWLRWAYLHADHHLRQFGA